MIEFELKFQVDPGHRSAVEAAVARGRSRRTHLQARYFDTADGALAAQRVVLRLRKEGRTWVQTAKAPADGPLQRHEHNVDLPAESGKPTPVPQLALHDGTPVGKLIRKALRKAGNDPATIELVALYGTDVWRTTREMRSGDATIELAFDRGSVSSGERSHVICELEFELKNGGAASMLELARRWCSRYALWLDTVSKSARGERLMQGVTHGPPIKAVPPDLRGKPSGPELFRKVLGACLSQILPNASEVAAGSEDPEHVHQLRVGIRRLRTALREMAELVPAIDPAWERTLVEAFRALGAQRDREQLRQTLQPQIEAVGGPSIAWADAQDDEAPEPATVVRAPAFQAVLMNLIAATQPDEASPDVSPTASEAVEFLRARLSKLHHQVARDGRRFESLDTPGQHRVRKRLKRLRYLGEFIAPLFDAPGAKRYFRALEPAQDALGLHNDAAVAMAAYRKVADRDGQAWFAVGWLAARQPAGARHCHDALAEVKHARPFWKPAKR